MVKRKLPSTPLVESDNAPITSVSSSGAMEIDVSSIAGPEIVVEEIKEEKKFVFKDPTFQHSTKAANKKRAWRSLKQIIVQERSLPWGDDLIHYSTIDGPPSFKPSKKYSDISGLPGIYMDPQTKLHYATAEEFGTVRSLPMDITAGYLALRRAINLVG